MNFSKTLIAWYLKNKRDLPWRNTSDPYQIWLSEIILQQTRVEQGLSYYYEFTQKFPDAQSLAGANLDEVLKLWQGLGYYSRARNLHEAARQIVNTHKGKFPEEYPDILALKGVGEYTAAAVASFAFNKPHAVIDGNVYRLLSRVFGIKTPIDSTAGKKEFRELADELLDRKAPGIYNQAIMEFGSQYCKPQNPDCNACTFSSICLAKQHKLVNELPVKALKTKVRDRYFQYLVIKHKNKIWLKQRTAKDIWQGLFDFPLIETGKIFSETELKKNPDWKKYFKGTDPLLTDEPVAYRHILSHQRIFATFWTIQVKMKTPDKSWVEINLGDIQEYALPRLVDRYLEEGGGDKE